MFQKIRVPFPVRVFISYFAVVAAGAVPALIYLQVSFHDRIIADRSEELARRGSLLAEELRALPEDTRVGMIQTHAQLEPLRITYIGHTGVVRFDSNGNLSALDNHGQRPEVLEALGKGGVGVSRRVSKTNGEEHIYVAVRVDEGARAEVIRLAYPIDRIEELTSGMSNAIRNSQAAALTVAILLSLLAAYLYSRPLQRLVRMSNQLASGDLTPSEVWKTEDEIGDIGRALNRMALEFRTRLANSDAGMMLFEQLVEDVDSPMAVLAGTEAIAVNAAFRRVVEHDTRDAEEVLAVIVKSPAFAKAKADAETRTDGVIFGFAREKFGIPMKLFALKRAGQESLYVLHCHVPEGFLTHWHPSPQHVTTLDVLESVSDAIRRAKAVNAGLEITTENHDESFVAADVDRRVDTALDFAIDAAADEEPEGFVIQIRQTDTTVMITLDVSLPPWIGKLAGSMIGAVGGSVVDDGRMLTFNVPRA